MATDVQPAPRRPFGRYLLVAGIIALCIAGAVVIFGLITRAAENSRVESWTQGQATPTVQFVLPKPDSGAEVLTLPGNLAALNDAQLYARVPGYVHAWFQDIGARVTKGQLLATIDTPELDQQIAQAQADLASAQAGQKLSQTTANRWNGLLAADAVSKQETDEKVGDLTVKIALVKAAKANLDRLQALKSFARITAPFDGVVTSRTAEIGALVNAGAGAGGSALFTVADIRIIRVYVRVPQSYSSKMKPGETASLNLPEYPDHPFAAKLTSTSGAISDQSGTLLVEFQADNTAGYLKPGDYAQVRIGLPRTAGEEQAMTLPASALMFGSNGLQVAVIGSNDRIKMKKIVIGLNLGANVQVASGLSPLDRVVDNPPDSLAEGDLVRLADAQSNARRGGSSARS